MNRKQADSSDRSLKDWKQQLYTRRHFMLDSVAGCVALLFPLSAPADNQIDRWSTIEQVLGHMLPSEVGAPGAAEINALGYLKFVVSDPSLERADREFIIQGANWLEDLARQRLQSGFAQLDNGQRESLLRQVEKSQAGENWLSTLMLYLMEALLTDPVYGGNRNEAGWRWLQHVPGYPRPPKDRTYPYLLQK